MKKILTTLTFFALGIHILFASQPDSLNNVYANSADVLFSKEGKLGIGGYGEVHYNQPLNASQSELGTLDVHRIVMFLGYSFSDRTQFVSEIEFEYAKELWVEQAFLQHKLNKYVDFKAGLLLIPMGIINEYHEPVTFNGVERPIIDNKIAPSTWREIGVGFSGNIIEASLKYQLYVVNGPNGYDTKGVFSGSKTLREGRQKGSKAYLSSPNFTGKIEYYGLRNLNIGLSGYFGNSQSRLFDKLHTDSMSLKEKADSSVVGIAMLGADARYQQKGLSLRGQFYFTSLSNTVQYNNFTSTEGKPNDLGSALIGYYVEAGYNIFRLLGITANECIPFLRYEMYNAHYAVENGITKNEKYNNTIITSGITYKLNKNAVLKTDIQFLKSKPDKEYGKIFNAGFGVMF